MHVLLLGATGMIGSAILAELVRHDHHVIGLARSDASVEQVRDAGADALRGDLRDPGRWAGAVRDVDAVIHVAATFDDDMGPVDLDVLRALATARSGTPVPLRLIYTGGCWLYGETGDAVATEERPFDPIDAFAWMVGNGRLARDHPAFATSVVHPAMTYGLYGDVFERFRSAARRGEPAPVWGSPGIRWPLVHRVDLATAYRLVLEGGAAERDYNVAAQEGVAVGTIARAFAEREGSSTSPLVVPRGEVIARNRDWAEGPMLDQQMSATRLCNELGWEPVHRDASVWIARGGV